MALESSSLANETQLDQAENTDFEQESAQKASNNDVDKFKTLWSAEDYQAVKEGHKTISEVQKSIRRHREQCTEELRKLNKKHGLDHITFIRYLKEAENSQNSRELQDLHREITTDLKGKLEQGSMDLKEKMRLRNPEDPKLLAIEEKFNKMVDDNADLIGTGNIASFKAWFAQERRNTPSIFHLKNNLDKFEGEKAGTDSADGLAPRRELFRSLTNLYKRQGVSTPLESKYIEKEGRSERKEWLNKSLEIEGLLKGMENLGLYSKKARTEIIQKLLKSSSLSEFQQNYEMIKSISAMEQSEYVSDQNNLLKNTEVTAFGQKYQAMSDLSIKLYLDYYRDAGLDERSTMILSWQKLANNEKALFEELAKAYEEKGDKAGFEKAAKTFEKLDFMAKKDAIKKHISTLDNLEQSESQKLLEIQNNAFGAIEESKNKGHLCNKTARKFKEIFADTDRYKSKENGKVEVKKVEDLYKILVSPKAETSKEKRNLKAYENLNTKFQEKVKELDPKGENPQTINEDWTTPFAEAEYHEKVALISDLEQTINDKEKAKSEKAAQLEDIEAGESQEAKEILAELPTIEQVIKAADVFLNQDQSKESAEKATTLLGQYLSQNPNALENDQFFETLKRAKEELKRRGNPENLEDDIAFAQAVADQVSKSANSKKEVEEAQHKAKAVEHVEALDRKHQSADNEKTARQEALEKAQDQEQEEMINSFYDKAEAQNDDVVLTANEENELTGKKQITVDLENENTEQEEAEIKKALYEEQNDLENRDKGSQRIKIEKKDQSINSATTARKTFDAQQEELEQDLTEEAVAKVAEGEKFAKAVDQQKTSTSRFSNLAEKLRQRRGVAKSVDDKVHAQIQR